MSDTETDTIEGYDEPDYRFDESDIVGVPAPPAKKKKPKQDKRSETSKANIVKALQARKKKKEDEFEIEEVDDSDSSSEEEEKPDKRSETSKYNLAKALQVKRRRRADKLISKHIGGNSKNLYNEQQLTELRNIVTKLAKAQKRAVKQKKTVINIPNASQPTQPIPIPEKKDPNKEMMKNNILRF